MIDACCSSGSVPWEISLLVLDILSFSSLFLAWDFAFVSRVANVSAHCMAAKASSHFSRGMNYVFDAWPL